MPRSELPSATPLCPNSLTVIPGQENIAADKNVEEIYAIHPDMEDDHEFNVVEKIQNAIGNIHSGMKTPAEWKSAKKRMGLKETAMLRVGFVFSAYRADFWYWEMIEMLRK